MSRWLQVLLVAGVLLGLAACGQGAPAEAQLSEKDAGRTVELQKGGRLTVNLEANPTTGYAWEVETIDPAVLKAEGEPEFVADSNLLGAPGKSSLVFRAVGSGQTTLRLIYHRSFEKGVAPLKSFEVKLDVK